jgi:predicted nucleic acid-binding protein
MRRIVIDATALLTLFAPNDSGKELRAEYEQGLLEVVAPHGLINDVLAELATERDWSADALVRVASELDRLGFELREAPIGELASWLARGLLPKHAPYAALASSLDLPLMTADPELLRRAPSIAQSVTNG